MAKKNDELITKGVVGLGEGLVVLKRNRWSICKIGGKAIYFL